MSRGFLVFFVTLIFTKAGNAQIAIQGTVRDSLSQTIAFATIAAKNVKTNDILSYTLTNEEGKYVLELDETFDSIIISFSHADYAEIEKIVAYTMQTINFSPEILSKTLDEVIVKTQPISERNDTLSYNVANFLNNNDRTLSDVLKKMPGIEVDNAGRVKYQGKYINKFYVEGKDLMEGNYGMINTALPAGDARTVQVLQNHQPIRMLKDKVYSPYAAINIKLKKDVALTGRAKLGAGLSPFLHEADITPMIFSKKFQTLLSLKSNNIGESLNQNINNEVIFDLYEGLQETVSRKQWLSLAQSQLPAENKERFLFNSDHLLSLNHLTGLTKGIEMRSNIDLLKSKTSFTGSNESLTRLVTGDSILVQQHSESEQKNNYLNAKITLQNNTENNFFKNTVSYKTEVANDEGIMTQQNSPFQQFLKDRFHSFQNSFSSFFPIDKQKKYNLNVMSMISYDAGKPDYFIMPVQKLILNNIDTEKDSSLLQTVRYKNFVTDNSVSLSFTKQRLTFIPKIKYRFQQNKLMSDLYENEITRVMDENWNNNVALRSDLKQAGLHINYNGEKLSISSTLPVSLYNIHLLDQKYPAENLKKIVFEPDLSVLYKLGLSWEARVSAARQAQFSNIRDVVKGNLLSALNQLSSQNGIVQIVSNTVSPGVNYKNPFSNIFGHISYSYSLSQSGSISNMTYFPNGQVLYDQLQQQNNNIFQGVGFGIGKYFIKYSTNISMNGGFNKVESKFLLNNESVTSNIYGYNTSLKIVSGFLKKIYFDVSSIYNNNHRVSVGEISRFSQFTQSATILFEPFDAHSVKLKNDYSYGKYGKENFAYSILDISYLVSFQKKKIDIEIGCTNVLNQKNYTENFLSNTTSTTNNYYLRPIQVLAKISFNIK